MNKEYKIKLDLNKKLYNKKMAFNQFDENVNDFYIEVTKNNKVVKDLDKSIITLVAIKPSGEVDAQFIEVKEGQIYANLKPSMCDLVGNYQAKAMIVLEGEIVTTDTINYSVNEDKIISKLNEDVVSDERFTLFTDALARLSTIEINEANRENNFSKIQEEFETIMKVCRKKKISVLVDEAYHYFYPNTFIKYALNERHVFITRTFSKLFSMAGCRLGYVVGHPEDVKMVQKYCTPHNTNAFAMLFAEKILETPGMLDSLIEKFNDGRKYLVDSLDANGYRHKGEAGNFMFIEPKTDAQTVVDLMKTKKKILIKTYENVGEFGNCLRVSIGERKYMEQFTAALFEIDK